MDNFTVITKLPGRLVKFSSPEEVIDLSSENFAEALNFAQEYAEKGGYVVSVLNYRLGEYLVNQAGGTNLGTLLFYKSYSRPQIRPCNDFAVTGIRLSQSRSEYFNAIAEIKSELEAGRTYQVNYTTSVEFNFFGCPLAFFIHSLKTQPTAYNTIIKLQDKHIISATPELFFCAEGRSIYSRPMKGTCRLDQGEDFLKNDEKNIAENVMIVDLLRNDLNRICDNVHVPELLEVEEYKSLYQMTSKICGTLREKSFRKIIEALFPCGSITGAPKKSTMEIIRRVESFERGLYTGSIGLNSKDRMLHAIAIRTVELENGKGRMGAGSGITVCSEPAEEYEETLLKAKFIEAKSEFCVFESILWDSRKREFARLNEHLERIAESLGFFKIPCSREALREKLISEAPGTSCDKRVRLSVNSMGEIAVQVFPFIPWQQGRIGLREVRERPKAFTLHKTSRRLNLDLKNFSEHILHTQAGELLEGSISNLFLRFGEEYFTPPVESGLLPGVERQVYIKERNAKEKRLYLQDLLKADAAVFTNSVRGRIELKIPDAIQPRSSALPASLRGSGL
ncbi:bifunctional chorismate-binding protein/class IV aminotransferase [Sedimentisphaera salicampi]|uniref:bifunctional chorismate-binding protein/class IV aminotransferase n=1 Tax=Sedimentisphaera salicampi TaxID=1941349 RepID=UPI000B9C25AC|nr:bifunctional anthranilate synthase component I family protein/class IV aminotransferase [Sedimentisphaera salicampi]OXU15201.1 Para-aminobenzoate synthase component 1 [Sedimentisphaera salicampi]